MAKKIVEAESRTCQPAWKGLKYIPMAARHFSSRLITDEEAKMLLEKGFLKESDFRVLPQEDKAEFSEAEQNCITEFTEFVKAGNTNAEIIGLYKEIEKIGDKKCTKTLLEKLIKEARKQVNEAAE